LGTKDQLANLRARVGALLAATLTDWALGSILAGFAADYLSRTCLLRGCGRS
jgi:hypothetical protein